MKKLALVVALAAATLAGLVGLAPTNASAAGSTATVTGTVTGPSGSLLSGVTVELEGNTPMGAIPPPRSATTGADGRYTLSGVTFGSYQVSFRPADPSLAVHEANLFLAGDQTLDVALQAGGRVQGTVVAPVGGPADVTVRFVPNYPGTPTTIVVTASATPTPYLSPLLEPGSYQVRFDPPSGSGLAYEAYPTRVTVSAAGTVDGVGVSLVRSVGVDGVLRTVSGRPVAGATVRVVNDAAWQRFPITTDSNGAWSVADLHPGRVSLEFTVGSVEVAANWITIAQGTLHGFDQTVSAGVVDGAVVGPDGRPVSATAYAKAVGSQGAYAAFAEAPEGHFRMYVRPGSYRLQINSYDPSVGAGSYWYHGTSETDAEAITLGPGQERTLDDLRLPAGATVHGTVTGADGRPAAGAVVWAPLADGTFNGRVAFAAADGSFTIDQLIPGRYTVVVDLDGMYGGPAYLGGGADLAHAAAFDLGEGQEVSGKDLRLPSSTASIRVTAVEPSTVVAGQITTVTLDGVGFDRLRGTDALVMAYVPYQNHHVGGFWTAVDDAHLTWRADVPADAAPGTYDVTIDLNGQGPNAFTCVGCLTVTAPPPPPPPPPVATGTVVGTVKLGNGTPVVGAIVRASRVGASPAASDPTATTDTQGRYQLIAPVGAYAVHFDGGPSLMPEWYRNATTAATAKPVTVAADRTVSGIDATVAKAAGPLTVTSVGPSTITPGTSATYTIKGTGFKAHGVAGLALAAGPNLTVTVSNVVSDTTATVVIAAAADVAPGPRDLTATRDGGSAASCAGCLAVTASPTAPGPTISTITPTPVAPGFLGGVDIKGTGLASATAAVVDGTGVTVKSLAVVSATKLRLRVAVDAGATPGTRTLTVTLAGGQQVSSTVTVG